MAAKSHPLLEFAKRKFGFGRSRLEDLKRQFIVDAPPAKKRSHKKQRMTKEHEAFQRQWPKGLRVYLADTEQFSRWLGSRNATVTGASRNGFLTVKFDGKYGISSGWHPSFFKRLNDN